MARPGFESHPKLARLAISLRVPKPHAWGLCEMLWRAAYQSGDAVLGDATTVAALAEWKGKPEVFVSGLLTCGGPGRAGLIDEVPGGAGLFQIHDLEDHAPDYVQKRWSRESERRAKGRKQRELNGTSRPVPSVAIHESDQTVTGRSPDSDRTVSAIKGGDTPIILTHSLTHHAVPPSSPPSSDDRTEDAAPDFVASVLRAYAAVQPPNHSPRRSDRRKALAWQQEGIPLPLVLNAITLAQARRVNSADPAEPIRSLGYFDPVIRELQKSPPDERYLEYVRERSTELPQEPA